MSEQVTLLSVNNQSRAEEEMRKGAVIATMSIGTSVTRVFVKTDASAGIFRALLTIGFKQALGYNHFRVYEIKGWVPTDTMVERLRAEDIIAIVELA